METTLLYFMVVLLCVIAMFIGMWLSYFNLKKDFEEMKSELTTNYLKLLEKYNLIEGKHERIKEKS